MYDCTWWIVLSLPPSFFYFVVCFDIFVLLFLPSSCPTPLERNVDERHARACVVGIMHRARVCDCILPLWYNTSRHGRRRPHIHTPNLPPSLLLPNLLLRSWSCCIVVVGAVCAHYLCVRSWRRVSRRFVDCCCWLADSLCNCSKNSWCACLNWIKRDRQ